MDKIRENKFYKHFKGNIYKIITVAKNSETLEDMVVYQSIKDETKIWVRPISMWHDIVDDKNTKRFTLIN